jgi:hypothetical protein
LTATLCVFSVSAREDQRQIGIITTLLLIVSAVILTLIVYTLTLERIKSIALLKLIGAPDRPRAGQPAQRGPGRRTDRRP